MVADSGHKPSENGRHRKVAGARGADGLNTRQTRAISGLLQEPTIARAALVAGVDERTVYRWLKEPRFKQAYLDARRDAFGQATTLMQRAAPAAVSTLIKVMSDPSTPPNTKVAAAGMLLKFGREGIELDDVAHRLDVVEQAMNKTSEKNEPWRRN